MRHTNILAPALRTDTAQLPALIRAALTGRYKPLFGNALWLEYEDLLSRKDVWTKNTTHRERENIVQSLAACGQWVTIYYGWRPNLPDEGDNHRIELAVAGNAEAIVTYNKNDVQRGQLLWPHLRILNPAECMEELPRIPRWFF